MAFHQCALSLCRDMEEPHARAQDSNRHVDCINPSPAVDATIALVLPNDEADFGAKECIAVV